MNRVALLTIGDELLEGRTVDRNGARLADAFTRAGGRVVGMASERDHADAIAAALTLLAGRAETIVVTGGLGPTPDDLTREGLAAAAGVALVDDDDMLAAVARRTVGRSPERNARQARRPENATTIENPAGSAPGLRVPIGGAIAYALPGVPDEVEAMLPAVLADWRARTGAEPVARRTLHVFGLREADLADRLGGLLDRAGEPEVSITVHTGVISVTIRGPGTDERADRVRAILGDFCFGEGGATLASAVVERLAAAGATLALAESLTGGLVSKLVVDVPGASRVLLGSVVAYAPAAKRALLDVPADAIARGVVTEETACAMAVGARARFGADFGLATTGVAGPGPESGIEPGRGFIALAGPGGAEARALRAPGGRDRVRQRFALTALDMLRRKT